MDPTTSQPKSCSDKDANAAECQKNQGFTTGYEEGKKVANTTTTTEVAKYTGYVDPTTSQPKSCSDKDANTEECKKNQGFSDGYNAHDTLADCKKNPQPCMIAYLQGFYNYFVQKRLQNVKEKDESFPQKLTVKQLGGIDDNTPADQWRYTWKTKTKGCDALKSGERFKPLKDDNQELSICLEQKDDMGKETDSAQPNFGSSKDDKKLESNQSLGYTVYLMDGNKVAATMEIIFSPDSGDGSSTSEATDTATTESTTSTATGESTTSDTGKTNP